MTRTIVIRTLALSVCASAAVWMLAVQLRRASDGAWNRQAIHATLESVIPVHNDVWFRYVLENRTDSAYRVADESQVRIVGRNRSTGALQAKWREHVNGEFPLTIPARQTVHYALVWTTDRDLETERVDDVVAALNVGAFVALDSASRYQIEFPTSR